jgi:hypothetical protein
VAFYPEASRVFRDIEMEDPASTMFDNEKTIQDSEGESRHGEEVQGRDDLAVIAKESRPELASVVGRGQAPEIAGDGAFGDVEAELQKLTMNSGSAPAGILVRHSPDENSNLGVDLRPAHALWTRSKAPEQPKASTDLGTRACRRNCHGCAQSTRWRSGRCSLGCRRPAGDVNGACEGSPCSARTRWAPHAVAWWRCPAHDSIRRQYCSVA